jgi:uncharacterized protein
VVTEELAIPGVGAGLLRRPDAGVPLLGGIVGLHGASGPERRQPLFDHLAETVVPLGYAVLTYDRRASVDGSDVPLDDQSADAREALTALTNRLGARVGLFAFSQGAWAACVAAGIDAAPSEPALVSFLILLGCSGVSPAAQMRFYTDELLRRSGYDAQVRARAHELRVGFEQTVRRVVDPAVTSAALVAARDEPWFELTYLPPEMPAGSSWDDMDFDPAVHIARVTCPTLLIYGEDEECVPAPDSEAVWRSHGDRDLTVVYLPRCGHFPVVDGAGGPEPTDTTSFSPAYTDALATWLTR